MLALAGRAPDRQLGFGDLLTYRRQGSESLRRIEQRCGAARVFRFDDRLKRLSDLERSLPSGRVDELFGPAGIKALAPLGTRLLLYASRIRKPVAFFSQKLKPVEMLTNLLIELSTGMQ